MRFTVLFVSLFLAAASAQTVTLATHYGPDQIAALEPCFADYEEQTGVSVEHQQVAYGDYLQTMLTSRVGGQSPDIYHLYSIWAAQLVDNGILAEPPAEVLEFITGSYVDSTVDAVTISDTVWGIPTEVSNYLLVYNKQILDAAGAEVPTTWDELTSLAAEITETNDQGNITTAGYAFGPSTANVVHPFFVLLYSNGVQPFTEDFTGTNLASPEAIAVLEQQIALFESGATDSSVEVWDFPSGTIAMMIMAPWYEADLEAGFGDAFEDTVGVAPIPADDDWASMQYAFFYGVDAGSDVQTEAWDFLTWLNSQQTEGEPSCMGSMLVGLGALTSNEADIEAAQDELGDFYSAPFVEALDRSITEPNVVQAAEIEGILQGYIERAWAGELSAEEALTQADAEISDILAEFY